MNDLEDEEDEAGADGGGLLRLLSGRAADALLPRWPPPPFSPSLVDAIVRPRASGPPDDDDDTPPAVVAIAILS